MTMKISDDRALHTGWQPDTDALTVQPDGVQISRIAVERVQHNVMDDGEEGDKDVDDEEERNKLLSPEQRLDQVGAQGHNNDIVDHRIPVVLDEWVGDEADA